MKNLAAQFLSDEERERVQAAVKEAEKATTGEIVPMIVSSSYHYPVADILGGVALSLPLALIVTPMVGRWFWVGGQNMWLFLGFFIPLFVLFHQVVRHTPWLKRVFLPHKEIEEEVKEAALIAFFRHGLYKTRDETGVLIFISVFERRVWVLADRGIHKKVGQNEWDAIVREVTNGVVEGRPADAICTAVKRAGEILRAHFPAKAGDTDELKNLITEDPIRTD
jgi:putative membrane protein